MTEAEVENELQNLKTQLALLQEEHARTRAGWLSWMRATGLLLVAYGTAVFLGVLISHASSSPFALTLLLMSLFMAAVGLWLLFWSIRRVAERMMRVAARQ